jgi:tRNA (guanine-N7-)-methyltransferase
VTKVDSPYENAPRLPDRDALDPRTLFANKADRLELEIGPGRGWFMVERLAVEPELAMLGLEIRRKWAQIVDDRLRERGYGERARVFAEDARVVLPRWVPACLDAAFIHFPDPWWKKRHAKRRVISPELIQELARLVRRGGALYVQTDVEDRAHGFADIIKGTREFEPAPGGPFIDENPFQARSPRERRAITDGLPVFRLLYCRQ